MTLNHRDQNVVDHGTRLHSVCWKVYQHTWEGSFHSDRVWYFVLNAQPNMKVKHRAQHIPSYQKKESESLLWHVTSLFEEAVEKKMILKELEKVGAENRIWVGKAEFWAALQKPVGRSDTTQYWLIDWLISQWSIYQHKGWLTYLQYTYWRLVGEIWLHRNDDYYHYYYYYFIHFCSLFWRLHGISWDTFPGTSFPFAITIQKRFPTSV